MTILNGDHDERSHVRYFRTRDGAIGEVAESHAGASGVPGDAAEITAAEYEVLLAELTGSQEMLIARLRAEDAERQRGDYAALTAVGIPEGTARRLTGYESEA